VISAGLKNGGWAGEIKGRSPANGRSKDEREWQILNTGDDNHLVSILRPLHPLLIRDF